MCVGGYAMVFRLGMETLIYFVSIILALLLVTMVLVFVQLFWLLEEAYCASILVKSYRIQFQFF